MLPRLLLALSLFLALAASAAPVSAAPTPCSPEAMARDMRLLSNFFVWTREGARNRLNACQGQPLTATPLPPRAPTYQCTESCIGFTPCRMTCRPSF